jgi:hypothetical protein
MKGFTGHFQNQKSKIKNQKKKAYLSLNRDKVEAQENRL